MTKIWIATSMVVLLALPSIASAKSKHEAVTEVEEDKAGYGAEREVDFKNLTGEGTSTGVHLTIELWKGWKAVRNGDDTEVTVQLMKKNGSTFTDEITVLQDGRWELRAADKSASSGRKRGDDDDDEDSGPKPERVAPTANGDVTIDGTTIELTIPWTDLGYNAAWIQVSCLREDDDESRKSYATFSDEIPNGAKVLEVVKP